MNRIASWARAAVCALIVMGAFTFGAMAEDGTSTASPNATSAARWIPGGVPPAPIRVDPTSLDGNGQMMVQTDFTPAKDFQSALETFKAEYADYMRDIFSTTNTRSISLMRVMLPDQALKGLMAATFEKGLNFKQGRSRLDDVVQWQEMPLHRTADFKKDEHPGLEKKALTQASASTPPIVLFKEFTAKSGVSLITMQNSYVITDQATAHRERTDPYAVVSLTEGIQVQSFGNFDFPPGIPVTGVEVVGVFEADYPVPIVTLLLTNDGSAHNVDLKACIYNLVSREWDDLPIGEWSGVFSWECDQNDLLTILDFDDNGLQVPIASVDLRAAVDEALSQYKSEHGLPDAPQEKPTEAAPQPALAAPDVSEHADQSSDAKPAEGAVEEKLPENPVSDAEDGEHVERPVTAESLPRSES